MLFMLDLSEILAAMSYKPRFYDNVYEQVFPILHATASGDKNERKQWNASEISGQRSKYPTYYCI